MTPQMTSELDQALADIASQTDDLNPPDLKALALVLWAERERIQRETAEIVRQMHVLRSQAVAHFTQLLLCARHDLPLGPKSYFDTVLQPKRISHD